MAFYKNVYDGFIDSVQRSNSLSGGNITEDEFNEIAQKIQSKPSALSGYTYKLRADNLEWELVELPPIEPEPLTGEEALTRYANTLTGANDPDLISAAETLITDRIKEDSK